jgi:hypothetical protein
VTRRLRAALSGLRTGRTYEHGLADGQDAGFDAAFNDLHRNLDAVVRDRLNPQPVLVPARNVQHLTLVSGGAS